MSQEDYLISYIEVLIFIACIITSSIIYTVQTAIGEVNRNNIRNLAEKKDDRAVYLLGLLENYKKYWLKSLTSIIFIMSFATYFLGAPIIKYVVGMYKSQISDIWYSLFNIFAVTLLAFIYIVFIIVIPKEIGRQNSENISLKMGKILLIIIFPFSVFSLISKLISNLFLKIFKKEPYSLQEEFSEEDVISMLEIGQDRGVLKEEGKKMINSIFAFDDKLAYEIMTPRTDVFSIDILDDKAEYIDELMEMRYSRIPIYEDDSDNIIGVLNIKDFLIEAREKGFENVDIKEILRPAFFVPETKNIDSLFLELQRQKQHIAILIDEYGGFSGIATMEDIIEEVMGNIDDEYDEDENEIKKVGENKYLLNGNMYIDDINEELNIELTSDTSETIGGFIIDILGEIPDENENISVNFENYSFEILNVKDRRIETLYMIIDKKEESLNEEDLNGK